jgi:heme-degrading monooxygenase HmoA
LSKALTARRIDALGANRQRLTTLSATPGTRLLPDSLFNVPQNIVVPKDRPVREDAREQHHNVACRSSGLDCVKSLEVARLPRSALYASHSVWQSRATFEAWTRSAEFRAAHRDAGQNKPLYIDHPQFEGFQVRQTVKRGAAAVA